MELNIKASFRMSKDKSPLGNLEDRFIRIPDKLRTNLNVKQGGYVKLKAKDGMDISLQVFRSYKDDVEVDDCCAYVSDTNYDQLDISKLHSLEPADDFLIGCDPEFFLVDASTGRNISASHFFPHYAQVGSDAGLAELRPNPSTSVEQLTQNMSNLILQAHNRIKERSLYRTKPLALIAASMHDHASAGFHIHFGLPDNVLGNNPSRDTFDLLVKLVYILDFYLGIPAIIPEGNEDNQRRSETYGSYGKPGDFRADMRTLEYRVPGGHLLRHPILTSGLFAISKVVMKDMLSRLQHRSDNFQNLDVLKKYADIQKMYPNLPERPLMYKLLTTNKIDPAVAKIDIIYKDLTKMVGFAKEKKTLIKYFTYLIKYVQGKEKYPELIETNWRTMHNERQ